MESIAEDNQEPTNAILSSRTSGVSGGIRNADNVEPRGRKAGGMKTLLMNKLVNKYKKKYRKNRRGRKMGQGRQGGARRRRIGGRRKADGTMLFSLCLSEREREREVLVWHNIKINVLLLYNEIPPKRFSCC